MAVREHRFAPEPLPDEREWGMIALFGTTRHCQHVMRFDGEADRLALPWRAILFEALARDSRYMLIHHNHPSGDPRPSSSDMAATRALCRAIHPLGMRLVDHVIWAGVQSFSFRAHGML